MLPIVLSLEKFYLRDEKNTVQKKFSFTLKFKVKANFVADSLHVFPSNKKYRFHLR